MKTVETPNKYAKDFLSIGERVGRMNKDHPDQVMQQTWESWKENFGALDNWHKAYSNWRKGFLKGVKEAGLFPNYQ